MGESTVGVTGRTSGIAGFLPGVARFAPGMGESTVGVIGRTSGIADFAAGEGSAADGGASCCWLQPLIAITANARHDKVEKRNFMGNLLFLKFTSYFVCPNIPFGRDDSQSMNELAGHRRGMFEVELLEIAGVTIERLGNRKAGVLKSAPTFLRCPL